jgi:hypothetical protein
LQSSKHVEIQKCAARVGGERDLGAAVVADAVEDCWVDGAEQLYAKVLVGDDVGIEDELDALRVSG